ncbi:class III extradiol ring-cleavage dioxygenase [Uliginosibacterium sp. 31-12]|uniref:DODA-type extradiol aromatic ring-opening family dioxygenase n=1 Tax=Uliginosibacterium sp. 31-12 TaxID=3062781 RepID=UPI0026E309A7|nr:class III extradiol ring-cleavage dioxygenase [Uliginosibacterium sp. 31-12]MDO6387528.1 class III extradiol ring-cleavage dioxygenase [Uliginosibacterium sp. 31-12]
MASRRPVFFLSHGSPMHAVEPSAAATAWAVEAAQLPVPAAVLMVSAHWESNLPLLGGAAAPETIHDFGGFPAELYRLRYPAAGAPEIARQALALLREAGFPAGIEGCRGLDHGAWVPMMKMYPQADVPVLQLSVQPGLDAAHHLALGAALAPLREQGVLIVGSGHMTHNLRDWFHGASGGAGAYAREFRDWVATRLASGDSRSLLEWAYKAPHAQRAHPTPDHFLPLFVALGAAGEGAQGKCFHEAFERGTLAMDAWRWD